MQWHIDGLLDGFFGYFGWDNTRGLLTCAYTFLWRKYPTLMQGVLQQMMSMNEPKIN